MNVLNPIAELEANVAVPFEQARAMPKSVYTSPVFLDAEMEKVFAREWYCVGRASSLKEAGDYIAFELAGQPLMVIKGKDGEVRCQSNVCLHRMSTLLEGRGNARLITCPYHGWTYEADGTLRAAPAMKANEGFCKEHYRLPQVKCEVWLGWVMVSFNPEATPVSTHFADVAELIRPYDMTNYTEWFNERFEWNTNWKILAENFMESYHLPVCHAGTIGRLSKLDEMICPPSPPHFNWHTILKDPAFRIACAHPSNTRMTGDLRRTTYLLALYPWLLLVSLLAPERRGVSGRHLRRRHVQRLPRRCGCAGALRHAEGTARQGECRGQGVHGAGLPRSLRGHGGTGAPLTPRASQL